MGPTANQPTNDAGAERVGLSLEPFRALRPTVAGDRLGRLLSPPYDVIDAKERQRLLDEDPDNAVAVILPDPTPAGYAAAGDRLDRWIADGLYALDEEPGLYVYEMRTADGHATRGLMGAVQLRDPDDGVILPHENTMAGPVADRLQVMTATDADLEPIYLVYDGGGAASELVRRVGSEEPAAQGTTADGTVHRLWVITDPADHKAVAADLASRRALIADGHHRYATYRERQRLRSAAGAGPSDRGLALIVDSLEYGPQVHAIHRVINGITLSQARERIAEKADVVEIAGTPADALADAETTDAFAIVLTDGSTSLLVTDPRGELARGSTRPEEPPALGALDVTIVHRGVIEHVLGLTDDVETVGYAHSVSEAIEVASAADGIAVLLRPTPVAAVTAVAAAGARMPRKSTLFTPKPASGLVMRRLRDQA